MNKKGFTLIEILAVIVILSLIITIVATNGFGAFGKAKENITKLNEKTVKEAVDLLNVDIENCDDKIDIDLLDNLGVISCDELHTEISNNNFNITVDNLAELGYISIDEKELEELEEIKITCSEIDENIFCETKKELLLASLKEGILSKDFLNNIFNINKYNVTEIHFVDYIKKGVTKINIEDTLNSNTDIYIWVEKTGETFKWGNNIVDEVHIYIGSKGKIYANENSSELFSEFKNLYKIELNNFFTDKVTNMTKMFYGNPRLNKINLNNFNTSKVTNMSRMFSHCTSLQIENLNKLDTSNVEDMSQMFAVVSSMKIIDLSNFNTSNVENMKEMFLYSDIEQIIFSNLDTSNLTDAKDMFYNLNQSIEKIDLSNAKLNDILINELPDYEFKLCVNDIYHSDILNMNDFITLTCE